MTKDEQKYVSISKNKDGTFSVKVDDKAGKGADSDSLLGRLYKAANGTDKIAIVSFGTRDTKFSITEVSADGKTKMVTETSLNQEVKKGQKAGSDVKELAGLTLLPFESKVNAKPPAWSPSAFSTEANTTQVFVATDSTFASPTQAIYAETLAHFGEFVRTGNPVAATHLSSTVTTIEDGVVLESGENEQANKPVKKPK
jgi:hypothetical protein